MHKTQEKLLKLIETKNLGELTLREIGALIGEEKYPQKVKHHLAQLEKKGFIKIDQRNHKIEKNTVGKIKNSSFLSIPILGTANCGPATFYADGNTNGYLKISQKLLNSGKKEVFAIQADGISMNKTSIAGKNIEDGDYLIVDKSYNSPQNGDVVVSVIDDVANVKKYKWDNENDCVVLVSESTRDFPPIFVHESDGLHIMGKVVQVIKKPKV